uniref:Uncharacterized protein n=1 Tax=Xenopus tropicalis TaxID=8364 RepID=A0A1B8XVC5_XENTR
MGVQGVQLQGDKPMMGSKTWTTIPSILCGYSSRAMCVWCLVWCLLCLSLAVNTKCHLVTRVPIILATVIGLSTRVDGE